MCECFLPLTFVKLLPDAFEWVLSVESLNFRMAHDDLRISTKYSFHRLLGRKVVDGGKPLSQMSNLKLASKDARARKGAFY